MNKSYKLSLLNTTNTVFMIASPLIAIAGILLWLETDGFSWGIISLATAFYFISGIGITAGYHRLFAHRGYKAHPAYRIFMLIAGGCALQNSALKWCNDHRIHHTKVDSEHDPYNIKEGFFYAHIGWILLQENIDNFKGSKDLLNDKYVVMQDKYYLSMIIIFSFILPAILGHLFFGSLLGGFFIAGFARIVVVHHCTFLINSLCHMLGTRPYDKTQTARDSWIMALFTFGEGYHNFHHTFQTDYRNGIKWYHYDPTKWLIWSMSKVGLTFNLKRTKQVDIICKMIEANLGSKKQNNSTTMIFAKQIQDKTIEINTLIKAQKDKNLLAVEDYMQELLVLLRQSQALIS